MTSLSHTQLDVLKMDVEGYEWGVILGTDWSRLHIGQLLVEFHPLMHGGFPDEPKTVSDMQAVFSSLESAGFFLASLEPVTMSNFAQVELVFIHKNWTPEAGWTPQL
jgi:microsomal dipeptidase-like Zn-dependent dipeptidase